MVIGSSGLLYQQVREVAIRLRQHRPSIARRILALALTGSVGCFGCSGCPRSDIRTKPARVLVVDWRPNGVSPNGCDFPIEDAFRARLHRRVVSMITPERNDEGEVLPFAPKEDMTVLRGSFTRRHADQLAVLVLNTGALEAEGNGHGFVTILEGDQTVIAPQRLDVHGLAFCTDLDGDSINEIWTAWHDIVSGNIVQGLNVYRFDGSKVAKLGDGGGSDDDCMNGHGNQISNVYYVPDPSGRFGKLETELLNCDCDAPDRCTPEPSAVVP